MSLTLNPGLISNLNILDRIPLPVCRLIIDEHVKAATTGVDMNESMLGAIVATEAGSDIEWQAGVRSLRYLLKSAVANQYPTKALSVFLNQKTCLSSQFTLYLCSAYEQLLSSPHNQPLRTSTLQSISWGAYNLKQARNGQPINKMYMKVQLRRLEGGRQVESVVNCQLAEFRLLVGEAGQIAANMN